MEISTMLVQLAQQVFKEKVAADLADDQPHPGYAEPPWYPRPSSAGPEKCIRQMVYHAMGTEGKELPGRAVLVFDDSSWHEELTMDWLRKSSLIVHSEQMPVTVKGVLYWRPEGSWICQRCRKMGKQVHEYTIDNKDIHGHIDFMLTDPIGQRTYTVDHKALSHFGFEKLRMLEELPLDYFTQLAIYMSGIQRDTKGKEGRHGILLVKNKNQSGYLEFQFEYLDDIDTLYLKMYVHHTGERVDLGEDYVFTDITNSAYEKFRLVDLHKARGTLPERPYDREHWRCSYCKYNDTCWDGYVDEVNALAVLGSAKLGKLFDQIVKRERGWQKKESEAKKKREALKAKIKSMLKDAGARLAITGPIGPNGECYEVNHKAEKHKRLDKELLDPAAVISATVDTIVEKMEIKPVKDESATPKRKRKSSADADPPAADVSDGGAS